VQEKSVHSQKTGRRRGGTCAESLCIGSLPLQFTLLCAAYLALFARRAVCGRSPHLQLAGPPETPRRFGSARAEFIDATPYTPTGRWMEAVAEATAWKDFFYASIRARGQTFCLPVGSVVLRVCLGEAEPSASYRQVPTSVCTTNLKHLFEVIIISCRPFPFFVIPIK